MYIEQKRKSLVIYEFINMLNKIKHFTRFLPEILITPWPIFLGMLKNKITLLNLVGKPGVLLLNPHEFRILARKFTERACVLIRLSFTYILYDINILLLFIRHLRAFHHIPLNVTEILVHLDSPSRHINYIHEIKQKKKERNRYNSVHHNSQHSTPIGILQIYNAKLNYPGDRPQLKREALKDAGKFS